MKKILTTCWGLICFFSFLNLLEAAEIPTAKLLSDISVRVGNKFSISGLYNIIGHYDPELKGIDSQNLKCEKTWDTGISGSPFSWDCEALKASKNNIYFLIAGNKSNSIEIEILGSEEKKCTTRGFYGLDDWYHVELIEIETRSRSDNCLADDWKVMVNDNTLGIIKKGQQELKIKRKNKAGVNVKAKIGGKWTDDNYLMIEAAENPSITGNKSNSIEDNLQNYDNFIESDGNVIKIDVKKIIRFCAKDHKNFKKCLIKNIRTVQSIILSETLK